MTDETLKTFRVYEPAAQTQDQARDVLASDPADAAKRFIEQLAGANFETEVAVIADNGTESLFGYRQMVPQAHLDD